MPLSFGLTDPAVERFLYESLPARPAVLAEMEAHAARENVPIIGPLEGRFLYVLALAGHVHDILELGTATGYSAAWLGLAARAGGGHVLSLERDARRAALAESFWERAGLGGICRVRQGDAATLLRGLPDAFDFIFVDILTALPDAAAAADLADLCLAHLRAGGMLVADNALRHGRLADPANVEPGVALMRAYLDRVAVAPGCDTVIVPLRDGVALTVRRPAPA